jgi:tetratricopeptide (TPR) repeat protein
MGDDALQGRNAFLEEAETFLDACDDETALALAEARLQQMPGDLDARSVICRVRIRQGRLNEAGEMLRGMEVSLASLSRVYACMGDACLEKGMQESAQTYYRKFMSLNPDAPLSPEISEKLKGIAQEPETDAEGEAGDAAQVPSDFQTVTLAELYIRQGHLRPAAEVLEAIIRKEPEHEKAAALLREVWEMILQEESRQRYPHVIDELSRWLDNIGRMRGHAA